MTKRPNGPHAAWPAVFVFLGLIDLGVLLALLLKGTDISLFHPKGLIAQQELRLIIVSVAVLMAIAIPALFLFYFFAWKYRETNDSAGYDPDRRHGKFFIFTIWAIPSIFMAIMGIIMWTSTHKLDPHTPISSNAKPLTVQVIALRWKWLFIYPEQHIATVNYVMLPTGKPVQFELTADEAPMSSFWIPHLSGQLYAMTGMINTLNLQADTPGDYLGSSAEINGAGFAGMKFTTHVDSPDAFNQWTESVAASYGVLDEPTYQQLLKPSENNLAAYYSSPQAGLYDKVVMKYMDSSKNDMSGMKMAGATN